jgi:hypothetical protein
MATPRCAVLLRRTPAHPEGMASRRIQRLADQLVRQQVSAADEGEGYLLDTQYRARMDAMNLPVPTSGPFVSAGIMAAGDPCEPILDWDKVVEQFDQEAFMRDGVAILKGIFTPEATAKLVASCEHVQRCNDEWLDHDWHEPSQWEPLGLSPPTCPPPTDEEKDRARGGCQFSGVLSPIWQSVCENSDPSAVPAGNTGTEHNGPSVEVRGRVVAYKPGKRGYVAVSVWQHYRHRL